MKNKLAISMFGQKRLSREGGIEIVVKELCTRMARDGCAVTCYNRSGHHVSGAEYDQKTEYEGIRQKYVPTIEKKGLAAVSSSAFAALYSAFGKYDVVHIHAEGPAFFSWLPKLFGKKVVVTVHGIDWQREKWKSGFGSKFIRQGEKNAVKYADEIIVLSKGVTSSRRNAYIGHNCDQVTDRTVLPNDVAKISVQMPIVLDDVSEWNCTINANKAVLELYHRGGGPAHINLETTYSKKKVTDIQPVRIIRRFMKYDELPNITTQRVCIFVGAHVEMDDKLERAISEFCKKYNGIVLCDHTSNYRGEYRAFCNIVANQYYWKSTIQNVELMVHIGDISSSDYKIQAKEVWRVNPDGEIRDTFQKLYNVFEMKEVEFFEYYNKKKKDYSNNELLIAYHQEEKEILSRMPELPFSNIWIASVTAKKLPADSVLHLGIRNSLRSWNYFDTQETVTGYSNTGGFGIDGSLSTVIGAALCHPDRLYYCVLGDLAFFYDMNALGNRHVPSNIRILVVNNGLGFEMKFPASWGYSIANSIGVSEDNYVCAAGHYSSPDLIKSYVYGLGFEYLKVSTKDQYFDCLPKIVSNEKQDRTLVVEIVVNSENEDAALNLIGSIMVDESNAAKAAIKKAIGKKGIDAIKKMMGR